MQFRPVDVRGGQWDVRRQVPRLPAHPVADAAQSAQIQRLPVLLKNHVGVNAVFVPTEQFAGPP